MRISRTKLRLLLLYLASLGFVLWFRDPQVSFRFTLGCWLFLGFVMFLLIATQRMLHCPRCDQETSYFDNWRPWVRYRYIRCRRCGCIMDRAQGGRETTASLATLQRHWQWKIVRRQEHQQSGTAATNDE